VLDNKPTLNPNLKNFWRKRGIRNRVLYGGRDSSKTWDAAGFAIYLASKVTVRFLCTRQFQNKIAESVYTTLKNQIIRFGLEDEFEILNNNIRHIVTDSEFIFYGLWRNIDEIKSLEGIDICWIEEAHNLTKIQWEILEPTLRKEGSEFWLIFNPKLLTDYVYQRFVVNPPKNTLIRKINYTENPFLSNTSLSVIEAKKEESIEDYNHVYLGEPKQDDNDAIIKRSWLLVCIDAHIKLGLSAVGGKVIGFDVADDGGDTNATVLRHGCLTTNITEWEGKEDELLKSATKVYNSATDDKASINYDSIGVGASMGSKFKELNIERKAQALINNKGFKSIEFHKFNAGEKVREPDATYKDTDVTNKDHFSNLKAQAWWSIADRLKVTYNAITKDEPYEEDEIISISSDVDHLEKLINELTQPRKDHDNFNRIKVESKKDLKKRGVVSPNIADAFIMSYFNVKTVNPLLAAMRS